MELKDTLDLMLSDNKDDRLKAEYYQTKIRYEKLVEKITKVQKGEVDIDGPIAILNEQRDVMFEYLCVLEKRANQEGVEL